MSSNEIIDVLNEAGDVIATLPRDEAERDNHISTNVLIFLFDTAGRVWVQLRPQNRRHFPGLWDISACGGVLSGEAPEAGAWRETQEETGLDVQLRYVESFLNVFPSGNGADFRRMSHLYVGVTDEMPQVNPAVDEFRLWDAEELKRDIQAHPSKYIPSFLVELEKAVAAPGIINQ